MSNDGLELTRRQILAGAGALGAVGAGAGGGTSALFSDEETVGNNALAAGTLDLEVEITMEAVGGEFDLAVADGSSLDSPGDGIVIDGDRSSENGGRATAAELRLVLDDVKPGDWWVWRKCIRVRGNSAYVNQTADPDSPDPRDADGDGEATLRSHENTNAENGRTEPEADVDGTTGPGGGELGKRLRVRVGDGYGGGDGVGGSGPRGRTNAGASISLGGDEDVTFAGETTLNPLDLFFQGTLNHALWALGADMVRTDRNGDPVVDDRGDPVGIDDPDVGTLGVAGWNGLTLADPIDRGAPGSAATRFESSDRYDRHEVDHTAAGPGLGLARDNTDLTTVGPGGDAAEVCVYEKYFVPREVGNEIQGDSVSWRLIVRAEQARHNDDPFGDPVGDDPTDVDASITFDDQTPEAPA